MESQRAVCERKQLQFPPRYQSAWKITPSNPSPNSFSCSRMSENHREPGVPEEEVPVVEYFDGHASITLQELAITHFGKSGTLQNAYSTRPWVVVGLEKSAHVRIVRLKNSLAKVPKRMVTKSSVAMLKKGDWQERGPVTDQSHDRSEKPDNRSYVEHPMHDTWVVYFKTWRRRSLFSRSAQTCRNRSSV